MYSVFQIAVTHFVRCFRLLFENTVLWEFVSTVWLFYFSCLFVFQFKNKLHVPADFQLYC